MVKVKNDDFVQSVKMSVSIEKKDYPSKPGVYLMKDGNGRVLYVGKAKNIKTRLQQYWNRKDTRKMIPYLLDKTKEVQTIVVYSEKEALILEHNLIKKHRPLYNIFLRDDKTYIALKISQGKWSHLQLVRWRGKEKEGEVYGPYPSIFVARKIYDFLQQLFPLRRCSDRQFSQRKRPCILYDMKRCLAPCVGLCSEEEYRLLVDEVRKVLKGEIKDISKALQKKMHSYAKNLEFEKADEVLRLIKYLKAMLEKQRVDNLTHKEIDILGWFKRYDKVVLSRLSVRDGALSDSYTYCFDHIIQDKEEVVRVFLLQYYNVACRIPPKIVIPFVIQEKKVIEEILCSRKGKKVELCCPSRGENFSLLKMANKNAQAVWEEKKEENKKIESILLDLQTTCHLKNYPKVIECFDLSNISGTSAVGAKVVFVEGKREKKRLRRYKIQTTKKQDDYAMLKEVLLRRIKRGKEEEDFPDLMIIDGGKGHLNIAKQIMEEEKLLTLDIIGIAKWQGKHDKGLKKDKIYLINQKEPICLSSTSSLLLFLQEIRDEAHRVVIGYHRKRRKKHFMLSPLENIFGIGKEKKKRLLKYFGSLEEIKKADIEELCKVKTVSERDAKEIFNYFHRK